MRRTEMLQEIRKMRFEEMYVGWQKGRFSQEEAARVLGVCPRTFRRQMKWYSNYGHLEKSNIENKQFEVNYDNRKKELFKAI